ncbi:hypothetical protein [Actinocorallia populi]|uniref:hypothetical protein n=1 Tax=Actinocorallia populi TaxID=2079200 RepID=UPI000D086740|nr:hypothetical protein [Actinocorallia populi]
MQLQLPRLTARLVDARSLAQQFDAAITGLEAAERAAHALAEHSPEGTSHAYLSACDEAGLAIRDLLAIPVLSRPEETYLAEGGAPVPLVLALTALTDQIARTLMSAANKTSATDRTACLAAAHHACLVTKALR